MHHGRAHENEVGVQNSQTNKHGGYGGRFCRELKVCKTRNVTHKKDFPNVLLISCFLNKRLDGKELTDASEILNFSG